MWVKIFDVQEGVIRPTEHCYTLSTLKAVIDSYPDDHMKIFLYIHYMTCPDPHQNPFFNLPETEKVEAILHEVKLDISLDDPIIDDALKFCDELFDTPTKRAYHGMKVFMDNIAVLFRTQALSAGGKDQSLSPMVMAAEKYQKLRESFKGIEKDYNEEIKNRVRGDRFKSYDQ